MGYFGGRVPKHDHSNEGNGGALASSLILGAITLTGAIAGTTGYFTGSLGAANVTASSMTVSGQVAVGSIKFPDNSTLTTAPSSLDFGPSTATLSVSTSALSSRLGQVATSTNTLSASTITLVGRFDPVATSTTALSVSTVALSARLDAVGTSTTTLSASTATLALGPVLSSQTVTANIDLGANIETIISTTSFSPIEANRKILGQGAAAIVRLNNAQAAFDFRILRSSKTACDLSSTQIDTTWKVQIPNATTATVIVPFLWADVTQSTNTHFYCVTAKQSSGVAQRVSTRTVTLSGWR